MRFGKIIVLIWKFGDCFCKSIKNSCSFYLSLLSGLTCATSFQRESTVMYRNSGTNSDLTYTSANQNNFIAIQRQLCPVPISLCNSIYSNEFIPDSHPGRDTGSLRRLIGLLLQYKR